MRLPTLRLDTLHFAANTPYETKLISDPDRAALTVLDGILSTGESSRLYQSLVYDKQIAAQIGSNPDFAQQAGNAGARPRVIFNDVAELRSRYFFEGGR